MTSMSIDNDGGIHLEQHLQNSLWVGEFKDVYIVLVDR